MLIGVLREKDLSILILFTKKTWQQSYPNYCTKKSKIIDMIFNYDEIKKKINDPHNIVFGALQNEQLVGYAQLKLLSGKSFLDKIYVDSTLQRQTIGKQLLMTCFNYTISANIFSMKLEVEDINSKAISFYEKFSFILQPIKKLYPSSGPERYYNSVMICSNLKKAVNELEENNLSQRVA